MSTEIPDGEFAACLQSVGTVMFLDTWFPTQGNVESYRHIELTYRQHWNQHKIEIPQKKNSVQEEVDGRDVLKVTICFSGETLRDIDRPLDGDTRGDLRSHIDEVSIHAGMDDFHRRLVAGVAITATCASAILTVNRDKKRDILLEISSKHSKYRADRMAARIVAYIISNEKTTKQVSFSNEQVDTIQDVSMPRTFLSKNIYSSTTAEDLSKIWEISISQAALTLKKMIQKLTRSAIIPLARIYRADQMFDVCRIHGKMSTNTMDARCQSIHEK